MNIIECLIENKKQFENISVRGLMTMAYNTDDEKIIRSSFKKLALLKENINKKFTMNLEYLSMGMSNDYLYAIDEGATHLRIGSAFF